MIELDNTQRAKVQHFLSDKVMADAVYQSIQSSFLAGHPTDVYVLAASRLALDYLRTAWKDLEKCQPDNKSGEGKKLEQVGM